MKRISTATTTTFVLFGAFVSTAFAQSRSMVVNVSHDVVIGVRTLPVERDAPLARDALTFTHVGATFLLDGIEQREERAASRQR